MDFCGTVFAKCISQLAHINVPVCEQSYGYGRCSWFSLFRYLGGYIDCYANDLSRLL